MSQGDYNTLLVLWTSYILSVGIIYNAYSAINGISFSMGLRFSRKTSLDILSQVTVDTFVSAVDTVEGHVGRKPGRRGCAAQRFRETAGEMWGIAAAQSYVVDAQFVATTAKFCNVIPGAQSAVQVQRKGNLSCE